MSENLSPRELHSLCDSANQQRKAVSGRHVVMHHYECVIGEHTISSFALRVRCGRGKGMRGAAHPPGAAPLQGTGRRWSAGRWRPQESAA